MVIDNQDLEQQQYSHATQEQTDGYSPNPKNISSECNYTKDDYSQARQFSPECIRLNFDTLKPFESLSHQFKQWGVIFDNCIVIQPSNPAFPSRSGSKVVMSSPQNGFLEVTFLRPAKRVSALITSSQRLIFSAYDQQDKLLDESVLPQANVTNSGSDIPPNTMLSVVADDIWKVKIICFDGHFTLDEFRFCFSTET